MVDPLLRGDDVANSVGVVDERLDEVVTGNGGRVADYRQMASRPRHGHVQTSILGQKANFAIRVGSVETIKSADVCRWYRNWFLPELVDNTGRM